MLTYHNVAVHAALVTLALAGADSSASAQGYQSPRTMSERVTFRDLDINQEPGARAVLSRIRLAARHVCSDPDDALDGRTAYYKCFKATVDHALADLNNPVVTAMANGRHGATPTSVAQIGR